MKLKKERTTKVRKEGRRRISPIYQILSTRPPLRLKFQEKWYNENRILLLQCFLMFSLMHFRLNGASQTWSMLRQFPARGLGYLFSFEETLDAIPASRDCFALSQFECYDATGTNDTGHDNLLRRPKSTNLCNPSPSKRLRSWKTISKVPAVQMQWEAFLWLFVGIA